MKQKIAIITMNHGTNYGNKLQNWAMQEIYETMGLEAETVCFEPLGMRVDNTDKKSLLDYAKRAYKKVKRKLYLRKINERTNAFKLFNIQELRKTSRCYTPSDYKDISENEYDFFSVGSDQVWNSFFYDFCPIYLLDFVKDEKKKISYAASMGVNSISPKYENIFSDSLSQFSAISVREDSAKEIIEKITGKEVSVVLDPTLLIDVSKWDIFSNVSENRVENTKYIFTYFLGEPSKQFRASVKQYASNNNLKIIAMNDLKNRYYACDPKEFVYYLKNAEIVFTDSFHACVFSILFHRNFWVVNRTSVKDMNSRVDCLLSKFGLLNRKFDNKSILNEDIVWEEVDSILNAERKESFAFLEHAIGLNDD